MVARHRFLTPPRVLDSGTRLSSSALSRSSRVPPMHKLFQLLTAGLFALILTGPVLAQDGAGADPAADGAAVEATEEPKSAEDKAAEQLDAAKEQADALIGVVNNFLADTLGVPTAVAGVIAKVVIFLVILLIAKILAGIASSLVRGALNRSKLNATNLLKDFAAGTAGKVVFFLGFLIALTALGVNIGPFLAAFGVLGFVVGFALQDTLGNFASGVMILLYKPYDVGDVVSAGGVTGSVKDMNLVSTLFKTPDNQNIIVPNGQIWGGTITNVTANDTRRVDLVAGIGYGDDVEKAEKVLEDIVTSHPLVLKDPAPVIKLHELADSSVNFVVRPWSKTSDYWTVYWDLTREIKLRFDKEGISIPFPQRDVHLHKVE